MLPLLLSLLLQHHGGGTHTFEDVDKWVAEFEDPARLEWQKPDEVVASLGLSPGARVADIGAGSGFFSRRLAAAVEPQGVVFAVDVEPGMLRYISSRAKKEGQENVVPVLGAFDDPNLPRGGVDVVFICDTIHHVADRRGYYAILKRDLAPGGRLVIVDFEKQKDAPVGPPIEMRLDKAELVGEIEKAGFKLQKDVKLLPYQYYLVFGLP